MRKLRQKLHSDRGASIVFAMAAFLIITVIAATIVSIASANTAQLRGAQDDRQAYLAVTSAAELVRDALNGQSLSCTVTTPWEGGAPDESHKTVGEDGATPGKGVLSQTAHDLLLSMAGTILTDGGAAAGGTLTLSGADGAAAVNAVFALNGRSLTVTLKSVSGESEYALTLICPVTWTYGAAERVEETDPAKSTWRPVTIKKQALDAHGDPVYNSAGDPTYAEQPLLDADGNPVMERTGEPVWKAETQAVRLELVSGSLRAEQGEVSGG